jgi:hypothetical protein
VKRPWTKAEDKLMRKLYPHKPTAEIAKALGRSASSVYQHSAVLGLRKTEAALREFGRRLDGKHIVGHRFKKGHKTWNSGMKGWQAGGRAKQTQFKHGSKPQTWVPIGTERTDSRGYLKRKVADTGNRRKDWKWVHVLLWEKFRGPIPQGHFVVFKNRNNSDIRLKNLVLVDRAENAKRNTIYRYPPELVRTIKTLAKLRRRIDEKQNRGPEKPSVRNNRRAAGR